MPRFNLYGAAALALAASAPLSTAGAQTQEEAANRAAITVLAPRIWTEETPGLVGTERTISTSAVVYIDDLNLQTPDGREQLKNRVETAAKEVCDWLDDLYPLDRDLSSEYDCVRNAVDDAQPQIEEAIARS